MNKIEIYSQDPNIVLSSLKSLRKQMASSNPPVEQLIKTNWVPKIVEYLSYIKYPDHQKEAIWILANLISGSSEHTDYVLKNTPLITYIGEAFKIPNRDLKEQCVWCISNIVGESEKYRNILVQNNTFYNFINSFRYELKYEKRSFETIKTYTWCLSNFLRYETPNRVSFEILDILTCIINDIDDEETLKDALWCIFNISKNFNHDELIRLLGFDIINRKFLNLLKNDILSLYVLKICGNLIAGPNETTQKVLDLEFMSYVPSLLTKSPLNIELCWIISNIAAGTPKQVQEIIDANIISLIIHYLSDEVMNLKKECIYVIYNIIFSKDIQHVEYIVSHDCIKPLCDLLVSSIGNKLKRIILESLFRLMNMGYIHLVEEHGLNNIESLQYDDDEHIHNRANIIMDMFCKENIF